MVTKFIHDLQMKYVKKKIEAWQKIIISTKKITYIVENCKKKIEEKLMFFLENC